MSKPLTPRGPLPARIYWFRRGLVIGVALLLVFGIGRVLSSFGGSDATAPRAVTAAQHTAPKLPPHQPGVVLTPKVGGARTGPLSQPTGACKDADILVQPDVTEVPGGSTVKLAMMLTTSGDTCTWDVSPRALAVKISSGRQRVWSSQDCPASIKRKQVVVRPADEPASKLNVTWAGHYSVPRCAGGQPWAKPGWYHVVAATLGGEPSDVQFRLAVPPRPVITKTPKPTATPTKKATTKPSKKPSVKPSPKATASPSRRPTAKPS